RPRGCGQRPSLELWMCRSRACNRKFGKTRRTSLRRMLKLGLNLCLLTSAPLVMAQEIEDLLGEEVQPETGNDLYLEVLINGQPMNIITRFRDLGDLTLSADAMELRGSGILPGSATRRGEVRLDEIAGLSWSVD